jgi:hypothetical protein
MTSYERPAEFLVVRVHNLDIVPSLSGLCVGYERAEWRTIQLADHVMEWLPEFALSATECDTLRTANAAQLLRNAARRVYASAKFQNRGEFGELFLHIAIRQVFNSLPAVSKIFYKSALNDTVKGFDAVHVVGPPEDLELWLGEAKFYNDIKRAIADVSEDLKRHSATDYLRTEFALLVNKIDSKWPHAEALRRLLQPEVSLDSVFTRTCIPVLLTYDSPCLGAHTKCDAEYAKAFEQEIAMNYAAFAAVGLPTELRIHLFLLPLWQKAILIEALDTKLKHWQGI